MLLRYLSPVRSPQATTYLYGRPVVVPGATVCICQKMRLQIQTRIQDLSSSNTCNQYTNDAVSQALFICSLRNLTLTKLVSSNTGILAGTNTSNEIKEMESHLVSPKTRLNCKFPLPFIQVAIFFIFVTFKS